jgi:hypothetical protein
MRVRRFLGEGAGLCSARFPLIYIPLAKKKNGHTQVFSGDMYFHMKQHTAQNSALLFVHITERKNLLKTIVFCKDVVKIGVIYCSQRKGKPNREEEKICYFAE